MDEFLLLFIGFSLCILSFGPSSYLKICLKAGRVVAYLNIGGNGEFQTLLQRRKTFIPLIFPHLATVQLFLIPKFAYKSMLCILVHYVVQRR